MSYQTQEDELRAKEAAAENREKAEESRFYSTFRTVPKKNAGKLAQRADEIVSTFNILLQRSRNEPYQRQEELMAGMKRLFKEQINVIEASRVYTTKINPSTADGLEDKVV